MSRLVDNHVPDVSFRYIKIALYDALIVICGGVLCLLNVESGHASLFTSLEVKGEGKFMSTTLQLT